LIQLLLSLFQLQVEIEQLDQQQLKDIISQRRLAQYRDQLSNFKKDYHSLVKKINGGSTEHFQRQLQEAVEERQRFMEDFRKKPSWGKGYLRGRLEGKVNSMQALLDLKEKYGSLPLLEEIEGNEQALLRLVELDKQ
jgi:hypothetical protein